MDLNLVIESSVSNHNHVVNFAIAYTLGAVLKYVPQLASRTIAVSVMITDDNEIRKINLEYRNKDSATNVLSFQNPELEENDCTLHLESLVAHSDCKFYVVSGDNVLEKAALSPLDKITHMGDIVISLETVCAEAKHLGKSLTEHLSFVTVHGTLHLLGYDHEFEDEAEKMSMLEKTIMLKIENCFYL